MSDLAVYERVALDARALWVVLRNGDLRGSGGLRIRATHSYLVPATQYVQLYRRSIPQRSTCRGRLHNLSALSSHFCPNCSGMLLALSPSFLSVVMSPPVHIVSTPLEGLADHARFSSPPLGLRNEEASLLAELAWAPQAPFVHDTNSYTHTFRAILAEGERQTHALLNVGRRRP